MSSSLLSYLTIAPSLRAKLSQHGYTTTRDLLYPVCVKPSELSAEIGCTLQEACGIIQTVKKTQSSNLLSNESLNRAFNKPVDQENARVNSETSVLSLFEKQLLGTGSIFTLCQKLDSLLGEGVALQQVTEFCGVPGVGKTQLCLQLAVDAAIPVELAGTGGECVYIDTEGSFLPRRCLDIAEGLVAHLERVKRKKQGTFPLPTARDILNGIHVLRIFDHVEQSNVISFLPKFLKQHPKVRIVLIDSIAFHFRRGFGGDFAARSRLLSSHAHALAAMAREHNIAVVLINQVTTRVMNQANNQSSNPGNQASGALAPALGESWAHACTNRVLLYWSNGVRCARLLKSPSRRENRCNYMVNEQGIRDMKAAPQPANYANNQLNNQHKNQQLNNKPSNNQQKRKLPEADAALKRHRPNEQ